MPGETHETSATTDAHGAVEPAAGTGTEPLPSALMEGLLAGRQTPVEWVNEQLADLPTPNLQSDHQLTARYISRLDALRWQLEQVSLQQAVAFETAIRQYCARLAQAHAHLCQLRSPQARNHPVTVQLAEADALVMQLQATLGGTRLQQVHGLLAKKTNLGRLIQAAARQTHWIEQLEAMETALAVSDADAAEEALDKLNDLLAEHWSEDGERTTRVDGLRHRLIELIKNS